MDVEMLEHMFEFLSPTPVTPETLGFDAIARVPTGGHFFGDPHTMERYQTAFYAPMLSNWQNHEAWAAAGSEDAGARATKLWQKALEVYEEPAMDPAIREALDAYVAKRREAIGDGEP
jgi:trimethylamine--corrinoid protein Co-methyltransferase